jgi:hypothetical protein
MSRPCWLQTDDKASKDYASRITLCFILLSYKVSRRENVVKKHIRLSSYLVYGVAPRVYGVTPSATASLLLVEDCPNSKKRKQHQQQYCA